MHMLFAMCIHISSIPPACPKASQPLRYSSERSHVAGRRHKKTNTNIYNGPQAHIPRRPTSHVQTVIRENIDPAPVTAGKHTQWPEGHSSRVSRYVHTLIRDKLDQRCLRERHMFRGPYPASMSPLGIVDLCGPNNTPAAIP